MTLTMSGHDYHFELENICRLFLPQEKIQTLKEGAELPSADGIVADTRLERGERSSRLVCRLRLDSFDESKTAVVSNDHPEYRDECELELATLLYHLFVKLFGFAQEWGIVTGVRPVKLLRRLVRDEGEEEALRYFRERLLVNESKTALCRQTLAIEDQILALSRPDSFSLYISIPFCPTRCDYCSFVSQTVERSAKLMPAYVDNLVKEIAFTGELARQLGLRLETVYFGGGTPTALTAEQLSRLLKAVEQSFDLSHLREYTVEAGRPDTVTREKLQTIRAAGVSRVSINPQTLRDEVLQTIGRKHTVEQFYDAFSLARQAGCDHINTDLIAGLPGDTLCGFQDTLSGILALDPESITIHTLSMKRASNLVIQHREDYTRQEEVVQMVALSAEQLPATGYRPYYLYRQSRMVGNQENVGWAKPGHEGLYNVYIMDETHTILGCGAGAVSKLKQPAGDYLERIFNYKFPYEYNDRLSEMLKRKERVRTFYEEMAAQKDLGRGGDQLPCDA